MRVATVCARGGSKGVPRKNLWQLDGVPLVARAVLQARASERFDVVVVSSDDDEVLACARRVDADVVLPRPATLATDEIGKVPVILHAVRAAEAFAGRTSTVVVDLDVSAPLRSVQDIRDVVDKLEQDELDSVLTASTARRSPYFNQVEVVGEGSLRLPVGEGLARRQDGPEVYDLTGAVYAWRREVLEQERHLLDGRVELHLMPLARAWDIDEPADLVIVEALHAHSAERARD